MGWQVETMILLVVGMLLLPESMKSDVVSLKMRMETEESMFLYINFYNGTFSVFYDCLSSKIWKDCTAIFASDNSRRHQSNDQYVTSVETSNSTSGNSSGYFKCKNDLQTQHLLCARQPEDTTICRQQSPSQVSTFQLNGPSSDSHTCVGIIWGFSGEDIIFSNSGAFDAKCNPACTNNSSITPLNGKDKTPQRADKLKTDTIVAITVTIAILLVVLVVGVVCWRRSLTAIKKEMEQVINNNLCLHGDICATNSAPSVEGGSEVILQTNNSDCII